MPKNCADKCEESLEWKSFPDEASFCMFCNGPLIFDTGQTIITHVELTKETHEVNPVNLFESDADPQQQQETHNENQTTKCNPTQGSVKSNFDDTTSKQISTKANTKDNSEPKSAELNSKQTSAKDTAEQASDKDTAEQASFKDTAEQASANYTAEQASAKDTAEQASAKDTAEQASAKDTAEQASAKDTAEQASDKETAEQVSDKDTAEQASAKDTTEQASAKDTAEQASAKDTAEQASAKDTAQQASDKDTAEQASAKDTAEQASAKESAEQASAKDTTEQASAKDTAEQASAKESAEQASAKDTTEQASAKDTAEQASDKDTAEQASDKDTAQQTSDNGTAEQAAAKDTAQQAAVRDTTEQTSVMDTTEQASDKDTAEQASAKDTAEQASAKDTAEQASAKESAEQASAKDTTEQASAKDTAEQASAKESAEQASAKDTTEQASAKDTAEQASDKDTAEQASDKDTAQQTSDNGTAEQAAAKDTAQQAAVRDTTEQTSVMDTTEQASDKDTAEQASAKDTAEQASAKDTAEQASAKDTAEQASAKESAEQASAKDTTEQASAKDTAEQASDKDTAEQASDKDTAQQTSDNGTAEQAAAKDTAQQAAVKDTAQQVAAKDTAQQAAVKDTAQQASANGTAEQASANGAAEQASANGAAEQASANGAAEQAAAKDTAQQAAVKDTAQQVAAKDTAQQAAVKDTAQQASANGTAEQASANGAAEQASANGTAEQASANGAAEQASANGAAEQASANGAAEQASANGAAEQAAAKDTAQQAAAKDTAQQAAVKDTAQQASANGTAEQASANGAAEQASANGAAEQAAAKDTAQQAAVKDTAQQVAAKDTAQQAAVKDTAQQASANGTAEQASANGAAEQASANGTAEQASANGAAEQASANGAAEQASANGAAEQASANGAAEQTSAKGDTWKKSGKKNPGKQTTEAITKKHTSKDNEQIANRDQEERIASINVADQVEPLNPPPISEIEPENPERITIQFYTIILKEIWEVTDAICLKTGIDNFSLLYCQFYPINWINIQETDIVIITGSLTIPLNKIEVNTLKFPYKYFFYTRDGGVYEDLNHYTSTNFNRHFMRVFPQINSDLKEQVFRQFDMMILPERQKKEESKIPFKSLLYSFLFTKKDNLIRYKEVNYRRFLSLLAFLPKFIGLGCFQDPLGCEKLDNFLEAFLERSHELVYINISPHNIYSPKNWDSDYYYSKKAREYMLQHYIQHILSSQLTLKQRLLCIYLTILLIHKYKLTDDLYYCKVTETIEHNLQDIINSNHIALEYINDISELHEAVCEFIFNYIPTSTKYHAKYFLLIIFYHRLFILAESHANLLKQLEYSKNEYWGFPAHITISRKTTLSKDVIKNAIKLSHHDLILPYSIMYYSFESYNFDVFQEFHISDPTILPLSGFLSILLVRLPKGNLDVELFRNIMKFIHSRLSEQNTLKIYLPLELDHLLKLTLELSSQLSTPHVQVSETMFYLILELFALLCTAIDNIGDNKITSENMQTIFQFVNKWHNDKILKVSVSNIYDLKREMDFWDKVITQHFPSHLQWPRITVDFLEMCLKNKNLHISLYTDLFIYVHNKFGDCLKNLFRKEMIDRLKLSDANSRNKVVNQLRVLDRYQLRHIDTIFSSILQDERERFLKNKIKHLFEWPSWGHYFELFSTTSELFEHISEETKSLLDIAISTFINLIMSLCTHKIQICDVTLISGKQQHFLSLAKLVLQKGSDFNYSLQDIEVAFKYCVSAANWIQSQLSHFENLAKLFLFLTDFKCDIIQDILAMNVHLTLAEIVGIEDENFQFIIFPEVNDIINSLHFLPISNSILYLQDSVIFTRTIDSVYRLSLVFGKQLDFNLFNTDVWLPSVNRIEEILNTSCEQSILLSSVDKYFGEIREYDKILREFKYLSFGYQQTQNKSIKEIPELPKCSNCIALYFTLHQCRDAAAKLLELRTALSIKSDFRLINDLENVKSNLGNKPLSIIDANFSNTAQSLKEFTNYHLDLLDKILDKIEFIKFVKKNMNDLNDLKTFVEISLTTSSGDGAETDRIMILHSVCTNFAPIIFSINKDTTYDFLIERCKEVFTILNTNNQLIGMLEYASQNISFWEELKRSQGSLEEGALMQLEKIVSSGIFNISACHSFNPMKMISLTTQKVGKVKCYDMEQLKDLRSKLTLVVGKSDIITQTAIIAESFHNATKFNNIFDLISDLAMIISELAETGNMRYFNYTFSCDLQEVYKVETEIRRTGDNLTQCKIRLEEVRRDCYFLNFYTISQLVLLQKGIRAFIESSDQNSQEQLYHLLSLLNADINRQDIESALKESDISSSTKSVHRINAGVHSKTTLFHSVARTGNYSFIKTTSHKPAIPREINIGDEEINFPENFSHSDRQVGEKLCSTCGFPLSLVIEGIKSIKSQTDVVTEQALTRWCMQNPTTDDVDEDSDVSSGEESIEHVSAETDDTLIPAHTLTPSTEETVSSEVEYIDMLKLGNFLELINRDSNNQIRGNRQLYKIFKFQEPNLIFVPNNLIYESVLSLYQMSPKLPLPYASEVLLCSDNTKVEEIDIFWRRVISKSDFNHYYLFCLVGIENLQYEVAVQAVSLLRKHLQLEKKSNYKLVIICSEEKEEQSYMAAALENYRRPSHIVSSSISQDISEYVQSKLSHRIAYNIRESAWVVDRERSRVRLVVSNSVGAGKSLYIRNLKSKLLNQDVVSQDEIDRAVCTVAIHGKQSSEEHLAKQLLNRSVYDLEHGVMFHVDISSTVQLGLEPILFKLLVLGWICKRSGELWHCRGKDYYVIETTVNTQMKKFDRFSHLFPTIQCIQPIQAMNTRLITEKKQIQAFDLAELNKEEFQRTFAYLKHMEAGQNLDLFNYESAAFHKRNPPEIVQVLLKYCGIQQPSWTEMKNFVTFLSKQLSDCDNSYYCLTGMMGEEWVGFKSFVVKFLIYMSRDFATPSLRDDVDNLTKDLLEVYEIVQRRKWENSSHPYIFFNPDRQTMTFLGFQVSNQGHLYYSEDPTVIVEANILEPKLLKMLELNKVNLNENYQLLNKAQKIEKLAKVMDLEWVIDPDPGYVLTLDNMRKILAILMRFRCNIPVVVMGETGCGKTRLIQFMCALQVGATNMLILKVHGGTTEKDVMSKVEEAEVLAMENSHNHNIDTVLFFDEANTSPAIGLIKEIMCDRRMYGRHISSDIRLQFIAACNPYRRHTKEMLNKLSTAGLGFFTKASEATDRLGDIPLRELVYRVMELPASLRPLVWDFGQLSNNIEKTYTREIVAKHLRDHNSPIQARDDIVDVISNVLAGAQSYMRERKDECSFVSLRDVERAMRVMLWFYKMLEFLAPDYSKEPSHTSTDDSFSVISPLSPFITTRDTPVVVPIPSAIPPLLPLRDHLVPFPVPVARTIFSSLKSNPGSPETERLRPPVHHIEEITPNNINGIDKISYSLILSLAVCYRARLQKRTDFDRKIANHFRDPLTPISNYREIDREIDRCQQHILGQMTVGEHIAKNKALKENVFMMFVCIELKIPLFVIGKPGSSKSLAKTIISNNMQGNKCNDKSLLRNFKQVHIMSYQCSQLSTAEGIIGVFKNCRNMQRKTQSSKFVSCVVLDEVGLAEDSPLLPLKVLHPLLEDSRYGSNGNDEYNEGFSTSYKPDEDHSGMDRESDDSVDQVAFIGISNWSLDPAKMNRGIMVARGDPDQEELLSSANEICHSSTVNPEFLESIEKCIPNLAKAYLKLVETTRATREYYGLRDFYSLIKMLVFLCNEYQVPLTLPILKHCVYRNFGGATDNQAVQLFLQKLKLPDNRGGPDSSPLGLIRANLSSFSTSFYGETRYLLLLTENYSALNILLKSSDMWPDNKFDDIRVIFGSNFPRDQEYSTVCRNINKIKVCMESGKTVILLNLENLYESLYDALNQYYMKIYDQRYVDLGLGTHRMKCRVHGDFKLIVIADTDTVYSTFPTPLINRLEKHFLTMSTVLSDTGTLMSRQLAEWANNFSTLDKDKSIGFQRRGDFTVGDCFIGYHEDTPSSIVFHVMKEMYPGDTTPDSDIDRNAVLERSQTLLLRMATTDAVLRVRNSLLSIQSEMIIAEYFRLQLGSLGEYLRQVLNGICKYEAGAHLTLATTHSRLLTDRDVDQLKQRLSTDTDADTIEITSLSLQQFQTEQQYTREIQKFLRGETQIEMKEGSHKKILLVQCERGADNAKLIACARHKAVDELKDWREEKGEYKFEVCLVFLIQLSREAHGSKFVSFCGGDWNTVHIDDIRSLNYTELPPITHLIETQIYQLFEDQEEVEIPPAAFCRSTRLQQCVQSAISRLVDKNGSEKRTLTRMQQFIELLDGNGSNRIFFKTLCQRLTILLRDQCKSIDTNTDWLLQTANCGEDIQSSGTFRKAVNLRINNTITPLIAELIACLDRNGNLELALHNEEVPECLFNLWHDIFRDERLLVLQYKDTISPNTLLPRRRVPVLSDGAGGQYFKCSFPFSFFIKDFVLDLWKQFTIRKPDTSKPFWHQFESLFNQTTLGELVNLNLMSDEKDYDSILHYLMDFIHMHTHPSTQAQYNVYESVILLRVELFSDHQASNEEEQSELALNRVLTIPKIHCAYEESKQLLDLLQQAFILEKDLEGKLFNIITEMNKNKDRRLSCLELVLLEEIITSCHHTKERTAGKELAEKYVTEIRQWQSVVERGLSFNRPDYPGYKTTVYSIRAKWNRILAVQLFVSNCTLAVEHSCTESSTNRLFMILTETPDFTSVQTIRDTLAILSDCLSRLPGGQRSSMKLKQKFRECATRFFISLLTSLTFRSLPSSQPNAELIELLMEFVILDKGNMEELERNEKSSINLFKKNGLNPSLSFKTFLLQLMIKHRRDVFEDILSHYLAKSLPDLENVQAKQELYMIILQSIEDSRHQIFKQQNIEEQIFLIDSTLRNDSPRIYDLADHSYLPYALLETIATLRYICIHISHWIIDYFKLKTRVDSQLPDYIVEERRRLIINFKNICLMHGNEYLHVFLLKNIYHQLGSDTLHLITENRACSWIIPEHVMERMIESQFQSPDYFMIYGDNYANLKYSAEQANVSQCKDSLLQYFDAEELNAQEIQTNIEYFLYSIFQIVTESLKRRGTDESEGFIALRDLFNTNLSTIQNELLQIGIQMLSNNLGNHKIESLHFSPNSNNNQISLSRVIYHMAIMLSSNSYPKLFSPISLLYENPHLLTNTLFPTMMDDQLLTAKQAMLGKEGTGQWYTCVNGHAYFVGECGQPQEAQTCPDCGIWVGRQNHRVTQASTVLNTTADSTKHGYVLGRVDQRQKIPSSERSLSPASVAFIRALMDISFIWSSCSKHPTDSSHVLPSLVRGGLDDPRDLPNFFYLHLERDVWDIAQLTGKNFEETTFLLHLIIGSLMDRAGEPCVIHTELTQRELREQWEKEFDKKFIQPILGSLHTDVHRQMEQVLSEKRIANNPLLRIVYERDEPEPNNPLPHLWRYRTIVNLEHFSQSFSTADLNTKNKCPLVDKFLKEENKLFVTRYLPDIVQLQRRVGDKFLHRLDKREAANTSIREFLDRIRTENKQESEELAKLVDSLATAWSMIGEDVKKNGRLRMEEALERQEISPATSLAYLLPSSTGEGVLITSLTDYLVLIHNSFVHAYRDRVKGSRSDKIPLRELNMSHVIEYEEHLQPLLLSHAHYSLALGQGSHVTYDFDGVEQQFMEQFIQNKPLILAEHLRFEYIREAYNLGVFEQVRHKVQQTELKEILWRAIREDLDSLEAVSDVLLVLDVVIGFLSSAGGDPEQKLSSYLYDVLKYTHASHGAGPLQSRRAEGNVCLKHILSFWRFLSIEKASKLSIIGQIPFSSLRDEFREFVSEEEREQIERSCDHFPVDRILMFLHDFILFFVRERDAEESNYGMRESIEEYDPDWKLLEVFRHFPRGIKLSQCASAWAVLAQQENRISNQLNTSV